MRAPEGIPSAMEEEIEAWKFGMKKKKEKIPPFILISQRIENGKQGQEYD